MEQEIERNDLDSRDTSPISTPTNSSQNTPNLHQKRGSLRLKYDIEVEQVIQRWGDLDQIRHQLGLSQRKICQLLLVDPSAWTRWQKAEQQAPPHIYRALDWFMELRQERGVSPHGYLTTISRYGDPEKQLGDLEKQISQKLYKDLFQKVHFDLSDMRRNTQKEQKRTKLFLMAFLGLQLIFGSILSVLLLK